MFQSIRQARSQDFFSGSPKLDINCPSDISSTAISPLPTLFSNKMSGAPWRSGVQVATRLQGIKQDPLPSFNKMQIRESTITGEKGIQLALEY